MLLLPELFKNMEKLHSSATSENTTDDMDIEKEVMEQAPVDANLTQRTSQAIATLASLAPSQFVHKLFKKLMRRLLEESQSGNVDSEKLCSLLTLSRALIASKALDDASVSLLYRTMKPMIRNDENGSKVQKQSYKVLAEICRCHHSYAVGKDTLKELIDLLTGSAVTSQVSARSVRLQCTAILVDGFAAGSLKDMVSLVFMCMLGSNAFFLS